MNPPSDTPDTPAEVAATDDPFRSPHSMLGRYLHRLRRAADDAELSDAEPGSPPESGNRSPFLSVITRTTGNRQTLVDTLACLSGQTDPDFEVLLMVNTDDSTHRDAVLELVASFDASLRERIRVDVTTEMHRVAPLNRALDLARGRYVTVLDDDDFVFGDWVEQFHRAANEHPGAVIRCRAVDQQIDTVGTDGPAVATSGFEAPYRPTFDLASHLFGGQSPPATLAVPFAAVETFDFRFDEEMIVCEDIEFYLRVAAVCGVADTGTFGMVYRRWTDRFASLHTVSPEVWEASIQEIVRRLDAEPLLMPAGTASRLYQAAAQERELFDLGQGDEALIRRATVAERHWASLSHSFAIAERELHALAEDRDRWQHKAETLAAAAAGDVSVARRVIRRSRGLVRGE